MIYIEALFICAFMGLCILGFGIFLMGVYFGMRQKKLYKLLKSQSKNMRKIHFPKMITDNFNIKHSFNSESDLMKIFFDDMDGKE